MTCSLGVCDQHAIRFDNISDLLCAFGPVSSRQSMDEVCSGARMYDSCLGSLIIIATFTRARWAHFD